MSARDMVLIQIEKAGGYKGLINVDDIASMEGDTIPLNGYYRQVTVFTLKRSGKEITAMGDVSEHLGRIEKALGKDVVNA